MNANTVYGIIIAIFACGVGAITALIAVDRGIAVEPIFWFIGGTLLGIIVLPLAIFSNPDRSKVELKASPKDLKICPQCAELVMSNALICRFCRHDFYPPR